MAISKPISEIQARPDPEPSAAVMLPEMRLCAAMTLQAVKDLRSPDPIRSLDALVWWLEDGPAWVNVLLGASMDDLTVFKISLEAANEKKISFTR